MAFDTPHSCTLPTSERPLRQAEFDALLRDASSAHRTDRSLLTISFDDADGLENRVRDLAARESSCCSFFEFKISTSADHVQLGITVPDSHSDILDSLQALSGARP